MSIRLIFIDSESPRMPKSVEGNGYVVGYVGPASKLNSPNLMYSAHGR